LNKPVENKESLFSDKSEGGESSIFGNAKKPEGASPLRKDNKDGGSLFGNGKKDGGSLFGNDKKDGGSLFGNAKKPEEKQSESAP
jgi:hypothetical protein